MNILILRFSSLGDVILTMPVAKAIKHVIPNASVDLGTKLEYKGLFTPPSPFRNVIYLDNTGFIPFVKNINKHRYDIIVDLHSSLRTLLMLPLLKSDQKKRYKKGAIARRLFVMTGIRISSFPSVAQRYLNTVKISEIPAAPWFDLSVADLKKGKDILKRIGVKKDKIIGMAPGAKWNTKKWNINHYIELAKVLENYSFDVVFVFGKGDEEDMHALLNISADAKILNTADHTLREIAYAIASMDVFVSGDTGLMHLAEASGTPVVVMFGPTTREFGFFPVVEKSMVIEKALLCRPCSLHGSNICKYGHHRCMEDITVKEVESAIFRLLNFKSDKLTMV
ncbi:MAG: glycosyltransferase family 9 protein [bacterium]